MWKQKKQQSKYNDNIKFKSLRIILHLYHTYLLLYCKEHIQIMNNHSNVNVETEKTTK